LQAFNAFFNAYHLSWIMPILVIAVLIGTFGGIINWVISPAKGLLQAAEDGYLPKILCNQKNILILQGILVSIFCLAYLLMPSVNGSYWLLTDLSTELYVLMYVLMFLSAIAIDKKMWPLCFFGIIGCVITLVVGFFPPGDINVGGFWHYELLFSAGLIGMILPVAGFYFSYQAKIC
jgi:amino acid transporter